MSADSESLARLARLQALLAGQRPIPGDLRLWLLGGLRDFGESGDLAASLGIRLSHGRRYNGVSLLQRAEMERAIIRVADIIGPRNAATAERIVRALNGEVGCIPSRALDYLMRARRMHGVKGRNLLGGRAPCERAKIPTSKNALAMILRGETRAALWGLTK